MHDIKNNPLPKTDEILDDLIESSTIFHTPVGDLEVQAPPIKIQREEVKATIESHLAPLWLIFPTSIFNTQNITSIHKGENYIGVCSKDGKEFRVKVTDLDKTWAALQKVFAEGVSNDAHG